MAYKISSEMSYLRPGAMFDFDGEKLVAVDFLREGRFGSLELCSYYVSVYDKTGLLYYGEYKNSLSAYPNANNYSYNCLPITWPNGTVSLE